VQVVRLPVGLRVSKGVVMPGMLPWAWKLARQADVVHLHLPQLDAAPLALLSRLLGKPVVLTYHCDLRLPEGLVHWMANQVSHLANYVSAGLANVIVTNTQDYAEQSTFLRRYPGKVRHPAAGGGGGGERGRGGGVPAQDRHPAGQRIIGMAARLATEKGVEYLVQAMPAILEKHPTARVLYQGQYQNVMGEEAYARKLAPMIQALGEHWTFLGNISAPEMAAFFKLCDVTVLPSINSTESFGKVQVEAMTCGTPVVASDLPGVRQPVQMTGMGRVVPPMDAGALARALNEMLDNANGYRGDPQAVAKRFSAEKIAEEYEGVFREFVGSPAQ
jgi:glycosyltransferase involved in cell wall biosynthesis